MKTGEGGNGHIHLSTLISVFWAARDDHDSSKGVPASVDPMLRRAAWGLGSQACQAQALEPVPPTEPCPPRAPWQADATRTPAARERRVRGSCSGAGSHGAEPGGYGTAAPEPAKVCHGINSFFVHLGKTQSRFKFAPEGARERHSLKPARGSGAPFRSPGPRARARSAAAANSGEPSARRRCRRRRARVPATHPGARPAGRRASGPHRPRPSPPDRGGIRRVEALGATAAKTASVGPATAPAPGRNLWHPTGQRRAGGGGLPLLILGAAQSRRGYITPCRAPQNLF